MSALRNHGGTGQPDYPPFQPSSFKRMRKAEPLPTVEVTERESREFFAGMWHGIALGFVIGAGVAVVLA
jgi:hypothetical protein